MNDNCVVFHLSILRLPTGFRFLSFSTRVRTVTASPHAPAADAPVQVPLPLTRTPPGCWRRTNNSTEVKRIYIAKGRGITKYGEIVNARPRPVISPTKAKSVRRYDPAGTPPIEEFSHLPPRGKLVGPFLRVETDCPTADHDAEEQQHAL